MNPKSSQKLTSKEISEIRKAVKTLNEIRESVEKRHPGAQWYLDGTWNLNLMSDSPFDEFHLPRQDRILLGVVLKESGGGDW